MPAATEPTVTTSGVWTPRVRHIVGAVALLLAAVKYLAAEAISAAAFRPSYDYAVNYISDLGVDRCGTVYTGREICSPLAGLMNAGFIFDGVLFVVGSIALATLFSGGLRAAFVAAALLHGIGNVIVGLFDETTSASGGFPSIHVVGALLAILFGNVATILAAVCALQYRRLGLGLTGLALGATGIVALMLLGFGETGLPEGLVERLSVYPFTASEIMFGLAVLLCCWSRTATTYPRVDS